MGFDREANRANKLRASPNRLPGETLRRFIARRAMNIINPPSWVGTNLDDYRAVNVARSERIVIDGPEGPRFVGGDVCCPPGFDLNIDSLLQGKPTPPHECSKFVYPTEDPQSSK